MAKTVSKKVITEEVPVTVMTEEVVTKVEEVIEQIKAPEPIIVPELVTEKEIIIPHADILGKNGEPMTRQDRVELFRETGVVLSNSPTTEQTNEEKIVAFIESRTGGDTVRLNEFLKSLYPLPQRNEPPLWLNQGTSKQIKVLLSKMQAEGLISIVNNTHELLGKFYHAGEQQITQHRNLNNVEILAKK